MIRFAVVLALLFTAGSCALTATRPVQEMSDTGAAIRAAKEVQADTLAPELYRQANEWFLKARREYKFKNFLFAKEYAGKARKFAEQAEFEAIKNGGNRTDIAPPDLAGPAPAPQPEPSPYAYPTPQGTPADVYDERKKEDDDRKAAELKAAQQMPAPPSSEPAVLSGPPIIISTPGVTPTIPVSPHSSP